MLWVFVEVSIYDVSYVFVTALKFVSRFIGTGSRNRKLSHGPWSDIKRMNGAGSTPAGTCRQLSLAVRPTMHLALDQLMRKKPNHSVVAF